MISIQKSSKIVVCMMAVVGLGQGNLLRGEEPQVGRELGVQCPGFPIMFSTELECECQEGQERREFGGQSFCHDPVCPEGEFFMNDIFFQDCECPGTLTEFPNFVGVCTYNWCPEDEAFPAGTDCICREGDIIPTASGEQQRCYEHWCPSSPFYRTDPDEIGCRCHNDAPIIPHSDTPWVICHYCPAERSFYRRDEEHRGCRCPEGHVLINLDGWDFCSVQPFEECPETYFNLADHQRCQCPPGTILWFLGNGRYMCKEPSDEICPFDTPFYIGDPDLQGCICPPGTQFRQEDGWDICASDIIPTCPDGVFYWRDRACICPAGTTFYPLEDGGALCKEPSEEYCPVSEPFFPPDHPGCSCPGDYIFHYWGDRLYICEFPLV